METTMNNLTVTRTGKFQFDRVLKSEGNKSDVIRFEVFYLKAFNGTKGVRVSIHPSTIEQHEGYSTSTVLLYNQANLSVWAKQLARKSDKEVLAVAEKLDGSVQAILDTYQQYGVESAKQAILDVVAQ
jgi:hypothetical protein